MNWKFWTWLKVMTRARFDRRIAHLKKCHEDICNLEHQVAMLKLSRDDRSVEISALRQVLRFKQRPASEQPTDPQLLAALVVVNETTPLWRAVHRIIDLLQQDQTSAVCLKDLSNEARQYNAGRLAMCEDLRDVLLQKWNEARAQNRDAQQP